MKKLASGKAKLAEQSVEKRLYNINARPSVRKSSGQTLFSTIAAHGSILEAKTWQAVLWQVLFPLLDNVIIQSDNASSERVSQSQVRK
jgi:C-terminal region of Mon2 protein